MAESKRKRGASASQRATTGARSAQDPTARGGLLPDAEARPRFPDAVMDRILRSNRCLLVSRLAAPIAHEIINPISAAVNLATLMQCLLKEDAIPAERGTEFRGYLSQVIGETTRAGRIASEMLAFVRASGTGPGRLHLNRIVRQTLSLASHLLKTEDVESLLALRDDLPRVFCDGTQMQQALLHLIVNAVEAVEGCECRRVTIGTRLNQDRRAVVMEVLDTGRGIVPDQLPRVFDPFFTTKERPENLGLGLTIARRIVEACRGSIEVKSRPGEGASVTMLLPACSEEEDR